MEELIKFEGKVVSLSYDGHLPDGIIPPVMLEGQLINVDRFECTFKRKDTGEILYLLTPDIMIESIKVIE
jgi:hypothetical protein